MSLSVTQQFLVEATHAAGSTDYFRWKNVGKTLGFSEAESDRAVRSLDERKLLIVLAEGEARLLDSGRQLAARLGLKTVVTAGGPKNKAKRPEAKR